MARAAAVSASRRRIRSAADVRKAGAPLDGHPQRRPALRASVAAVVDTRAERALGFVGLQLRPIFGGLALGYRAALESEDALVVNVDAHLFGERDDPGVFLTDLVVGCHEQRGELGGVGFDQRRVGAVAGPGREDPVLAVTVPAAFAVVVHLAHAVGLDGPVAAGPLAGACRGHEATPCHCLRLAV